MFSQHGGNAKIGHFHQMVRRAYEDIAGLDVAVNHPQRRPMRVGQRLSHAQRDLQRQARLQPPALLAQQMLHRHAIDIFHYDVEGQIGVAAGAIDLHDLMVLQLHQHIAFLLEPAQIIRLSVVRQLDCHIAPQAFIPRPQHGAHAALAQLAKYPIAPDILPLHVAPSSAAQTTSNCLHRVYT